MPIVVDPTLKAYVDPLTPEEYEALERSLLREGCRDALVLWGDVLVDGHNRYEICQRHQLPFQTVQSQLFQSMEDVHLWMIEQHLGRRSVSDFQRGVLALRKRDIIDRQRAAYLARTTAKAETETGAVPEGMGPETSDLAWEGEATPAIAALVQPLKNREDIARAARLSSGQVQLIEKIHQQATPELLEAVKTGGLSLSAAAAVSGLPANEQQEAASAGVQGLKQAAKRVREARRKTRETAVEGSSAAVGETAGAVPVVPVEGATSETTELLHLRQQVKQLTAENEQLRRQVSTLLARELASAPSRSA